MARNKRPALTSPWKIGFLVSLLLVAVSIGVGFFITRSFNITWSWIQFHGTWNDFTFNRDAFMNEMLMQVILVPAVALLGYLMITGAVRKYRRYLDSGLDYKRLIQSIKSIDDLRNEAAIRKLSSHPELRTFLLNLRTNVMEREKELYAREAELKDGASKTGKDEGFESEVDVLVSAIVSGHEGGFQRDLAVTIPELKRVENALRDLFANAPSGEGENRLQTFQTELADSASSLRVRFDEIKRELAENEDGARELEAEIRSLRTQVATAAPAAGAVGTAGVERALGHLDSIGEVLGVLGEETRAMAINTALQASSADASGESVIRLADGVRDAAAKFNGVAAQWAEASKEARQAFGSIVGGGAAPGSHVVESLESLAGRVGRWVERSVIFTEKIRTFDQHLQDTFDGVTGSSSAADAPSTDEDWGFEPTSAARKAPQPASAEDAFETAGKSVDLGLDAGADTGIDGSEFEKQEGLFIDSTEQDDDATEMFTDIPDPAAMVDEPPVDESPAAEPAAEPAIEPAAEETRAPDPAPAIELESPADAFAPSPPVQPAAPAAPDAGIGEDGDTPNAPREYVIDDEPAADEATAATVEREVIAGPNLGGGDESPAAGDDQAVGIEHSTAADNVIDLYELGAVDYEPENVHHNA